MNKSLSPPPKKRTDKRRDTHRYNQTGESQTSTDRHCGMTWHEQNRCKMFTKNIKYTSGIWSYHNIICTSLDGINLAPWWHQWIFFIFLVILYNFNKPTAFLVPYSIAPAGLGIQFCFQSPVRMPFHPSLCSVTTSCILKTLCQLYYLSTRRFAILLKLLFTWFQEFHRTVLGWQAAKRHQ